MDQRDLNRKLDVWIKALPQGDRKILLARLSGLKSVYPFNEYEYRLMYLLDRKIITFIEYETLRDAYVHTKSYLHLYGIAPRVFGGIWAEQHLIDINKQFKKPSKEVDRHYSGDYDLYLEGKKGIIKVEVKASRAINTKKRGSLETKALRFSSREPFWMNFQQLKLDIADVFIFIGVWIDTMRYWVLTNEEIRQHPQRSSQHRGGIESQIGITQKNIHHFKKFLVKPNKLVEAIKRKIVR